MRFVAWVAILFASSAAAQEREPASPPSEIIVTGTHDREEQVRDFVGTLTPARGGSIPFFIDAACPKVTGLGPRQKAAVVTRLRMVAQTAGIPVAGVNCVPNVFVIVTPDKRAFIDLLARKQPDSFGLMSPREIGRLARTPGPAVAWQLEGPVTKTGTPLRFDESIGAYVNPTSEPASRLNAHGRRGFDAAALVVETGSLDGITLIQLADYAAMRLFAKLDLSRLPDRVPSTILTVLTTPMGSSMPITLSKWDLGFLRGLYTVTPGLAPSSQRSQIAEKVMRELENSEAGQSKR